MIASSSNTGGKLERNKLLLLRVKQQDARSSADQVQRFKIDYQVSLVVLKHISDIHEPKIGRKEKILIIVHTPDEVRATAKIGSKEVPFAHT